MVKLWEVQGWSKEASWPWDYRLKVQEHRWCFPFSFQPQGMMLAAAADPAGSEAGVTSRIIEFLGHGVVCTALSGCAFLRDFCWQVSRADWKHLKLDLRRVREKIRLAGDQLCNSTAKAEPLLWVNPNSCPCFARSCLPLPARCLWKGRESGSGHGNPSSCCMYTWPTEI